MEYNEPPIGRPRPPPQPQIAGRPQTTNMPTTMGEIGQADLTTLPPSRFQGFNSGKSDERRLEDPFAHKIIEPVTRETRTPSPSRGSITPVGYQRKTNLTSGRMNGSSHVAFLAARSNDPNAGSNTSSGVSSSQARSAISPPTKARLSSVRDRVAMFERPSDEGSKIPYKSSPRISPSPRTPTTSSIPQATLKKESAVSKVLQPQVSQSPVGQRNTLTKPNRTSPRKPRQPERNPPSLQNPSPRTKTPDAVGINQRASRSMHNLANASAPTSQQKPLFGETYVSNSGPGYGIPGSRRRGSEGSFMHVPSAMFGDDSGVSTNASRSRSRIPSIDTTRQTSRPDHHRRAQSENSPNQQNVEQFPLAVPKPWMSTEQAPQRQDANGSAKKPVSKIPVRSRASSRASDYSATSIPSPTSVTSPKGPYPRRSSTPRRGFVPTDSTSLSSPVRNIASPLHSKSGTGLRSGDSGQLTASIIAPPPKVSPPLRSSKPRQSVSVATTAASRAKAIEKSGPSQDNSPSTSKSRARLTKRLPGLENVDLEARRRQIISKTALEKARQEELALERLRLAREREEELQRQERLKAEQGEASNTESSTIDDDATSGDDADHEEFETPTEELHREPTLTLDTTNLPVDQSYRHPVYRITSPSTIDSPTLGDTSRTNVLRPGSTLAPPVVQSSATTKSTDGTPIDTEPQVDLPHPEKHERTVLSQVMQMRTPSYLSESRRFDDDSQSDKESIQIMLRNTAVFPESARMETLREDSGQGVNNDQTPSTDSWTSSIEDPSPTDLAQEENAGLKRPLQGLAALSNAVSSASKSPSPGLNAGYSSTLRSRDRRTGLPQEWMNQNIVHQQSGSGSAQPPSTDEWDPYRSSEDSHEARGDNNKGFTYDRDNSDRSVDVEIGRGDAENHDLTKGVDQSYSDFLSSSCSSSDEESEQQSQTPEDENQGLQYRASLTRREDFESASPSFIHWSRFVAHGNSTETSTDDDEPKPAPPPKDEEDFSDRATTPRATTVSPLPSIDSLTQGLGVHFLQTQSPENPPSSQSSNLYKPPVPTHSPPPPPTMGSCLSTERKKSPSSPYQYGAISRTSADASDVNLLSSRVDSTGSVESVAESFFSAGSTFGPTVIRDHTRVVIRPSDVFRPSIDSPHRTLVNEERPSSGSRPSTLVNDGRPSIESGTASPSPDQKRLSKRRNIIKELIDTEYSYSCDMKVVVDIYKATAIEAGMLSRDSSRVLFGNCEAILIFSQDFLSELKIAARPVYKLNKRRNRKAATDRNSSVTNSNPLSDGSSSQSTSPDPVRDGKTAIGEVFKGYLVRMEEVYTIYVRHHDISIKRLQALQKNALTRGWLEECARESSDLTSAWDLGSLLVKPVQRFLKYPLLLTELLNVTNTDHPDRRHLEEALNGARDLSLRINESKRQHEIAKEAKKAKKNKKESVATLIAKAISRRTEKLRQQVGLSEFVEDRAYDLMKIEFMENKTKIALVRRDFAKHLASVQTAFTLFDEFFAAIDAWVNAGSEYRDNTMVRSEWLKARRLLKDVQEFGLAVYVNKMTHHVMAPLDKLLKASKRLETGLMAQRDSRKFDYGKYKTALNKGGKIDKKTQALGEEWNTLNKESKERMAKLLTASNKLVTLVLANFVRCNQAWWKSWGDKLRYDPVENPVTIEQEPFRLWVDRLVRTTVDEFKLLEAETLRLGICNGSYLADTANMMIFPDESPHLGGNDSPRQPSISDSINKRMSDKPIHKGSRPNPMDMDTLQRLRASSTTSAEASMGNNNLRTTSFEASSQGRRPATSDNPSPHLPQLHVNTPSPSLQVNFQVGDNTSPNRSAPRSPAERFSGIFSSAMPMTDSPGVTTPHPGADDLTAAEPNVLFLAASVYSFQIDRSRQEAGYPYLTYTSGEIFDVIGEKGELWLAKNQDDPTGEIGWIWNKHFVKLSA